MAIAKALFYKIDTGVFLGAILFFYLNNLTLIRRPKLNKKIRF
jgi:hypothetical protein